MMTPMKVTHTATYDAPAADVYAMLTDPDFRQYAAAGAGVLKADVTVTPHGEGHEVRVEQVQETQGVPSFAKKFAGQTTEVVVTETWSSPSAATVTVKTPGKPTDISGSYRLAETGGRTTQTFEGDLTVKVPLIGGKLEKLMADLFTQGRDHDQAAGNDWLKGHRP